jgi:N-acetylneuraminic acid mutarotase
MNKDFISLFFVVFFVASGIFITNPVWVHAQTDVETTAFISVAPNPAEANQRINIIIRIEPPPPTPNDTFRNLTVTLTHPDESTNILGPYSTNPDGSREAFFYYLTPSYGNVTLKLNFPGQTFSNSTIYYLPSESQVTLTVNPLPSPVGSNVGSWETKKPMSTARGSLGVAVVNGRIYAIGGYTEGGKWSAAGGAVGTNEEYDPTTDTWTAKTQMPTPRADFAIAVYQNKIYCIGGRTNDDATNVTEVYAVATNTWKTEASMPTARYGLQANVVDGKIYLIGGYPIGNLNQVYDPAADSWTTKASMTTGAYSYASAVVDNKIYVVGGGSELPIIWSNLNQIYDPETDTWSMDASAPSSVYLGAAGATTGVMAPKRIYVIGVDAYNGLGAPSSLNRIYDPQNDNWTFGAQVPTSRLNFGIAVVNDTVYVIGGFLHDVLGFTAPSSANEHYTPDGWGTLPASSPSPSPSLSPSPSSTSSPTPSSSPSHTQQPTQTPDAEPQTFPTETVYVVAITAVILVVIIAAAVLLRKQKQSKSKAKLP